MRTGKTLVELATEIERRANAKADYVAPVGKLEMTADENGTNLAVKLEDRELSLPFNNFVGGQVAEYTGIPKTYFDRMKAEAPDLLAANVNTWFGMKAADPKARRMVRTLDGAARAFLSDSYRPLENEDLADVILPVLMDRGLLIMSCEITERNLYIKAVDTRILKDVPTGRAIGDGSHVFFDTCSPAITVRNSEIGAGRLSIETGVFTAMCTNMAMIGHSFKKHHVGARADFSEEIYAMLQDDTRKANDEAIWKTVRDCVIGAFDQARFEAVCDKLAGAAQVKIPAAQVVEVVEKLGKRFTMPQSERSGILARLIQDADLTKYGLHAAVTRFSADVEDYDRATELERLGGEIIEMPANDFQALLAA